MITLRPRQIEFVERSIEALLKHGNTLGVAPTGCHAIGTPILMFDGHLKNVEDIKVGDVLMGPDNNPRTVTSLCRGVDQMYEIRPIKGNSFIVNSEHVLSLQKTNEGLKGGHIYSPSVGTIINISVKDYLTKYQNHDVLLNKQDLYFAEIKKFNHFGDILYFLIT
jgi:hypothetical protein